MTELCAQADGPAHCGRLVEADQLKALPNLAMRDGDTLKVRCIRRARANSPTSSRCDGAKT